MSRKDSNYRGVRPVARAARGHRRVPLDSADRRPDCFGLWGASHSSQLTGQSKSTPILGQVAIQSGPSSDLS